MRSDGGRAGRLIAVVGVSKGHSVEGIVEPLAGVANEIIATSASLRGVAADTDPHGQLLLLPTVRRPLRLSAYLASALTGLDSTQRQLVFQLSDTVSQVCDEQGIELYEPRKKTDPVHHADIPDAEVFMTDRNRVLDSDLVIHLTHHPSTGAGEELAFAFDALVPIILISHGETRVSRMITGIPAIKVHVEYTEPETLRDELRAAVVELRPILEQRRLAFSSYDEIRSSANESNSSTATSSGSERRAPGNQRLARPGRRVERAPAA